jgi:hypothetical protein
MLVLAGARSLTKVTERAILYELLGSSPKTDASKKKGAGSREGTLNASTGTEQAPTKVRSATSSPLQLREAWKSLWEKYEKIYDVELGGAMQVAIRKAPPIKLVYAKAFTT